MISSDTIGQIFQPSHRGSLNQHMDKLNKLEMAIYLAVVKSTHPLGNFECGLGVYIYGINGDYKIEASMGEGASASTGTGKFTPYYPGDYILVVPLFGDPNRFCVLARVYDMSGLSEYIMSTNSSSGSNPPNIPIKGSVTPYTHTEIKGTPLASRPEAAAQLGFLEIHSHPVLLMV